MLSARYLAGCTDDLVKLYAQLENDIICNMARRVKKLGEVTDRTLWDLKVLNEVGALHKDIEALLKKYNVPAQKQIIELFNQAAEKATQNDMKAFNAARRSLSGKQLQIINATAKKLQSGVNISANNKVRQDFINGQTIKVFSGLQRLTMTIADTSASAFITQVNGAYMQVVTGASDYESAFKYAVNNLASSGITTTEQPVIYKDSGKVIKRSIESAVRANILTGLNQTAAQITRDNCEELETDLVEVSAHLGARPEHADFQGKIYSLSGTSKKYPSFVECCHPGEPGGICGINCRHSYYPYFEGMPPQYSNGELDEMQDNTINYKGREITQYEAEQQLRHYERGIRTWKLKADSLAAAGYTDDPLYFKARQKIGAWQKDAAQFCKETGLERDYAREYIGTPGGTQPRGKK